MKRTVTTLSMLIIGLATFAQTFCLQLSEVSNDGNNYVVKIEMQGSVPFQLGSGNLQFSFPESAFEAPTLFSTTMVPPQYFNPSVTSSQPGQASLNIELVFPDTGMEIAIAPNWTELAQISFPIENAGAITPLEWSYNGGTTQTVVFADDEATQLFATSLECLGFATAEVDIIRLTKVDPTANEITISNLGATTVDISDWRLCSNFNYTFTGMDGDAAVAVVSGDFNLSPDEVITLTWAPATGFRDAGDDIGLYFPVGGFALATSMADFVQYLSAGNGRESVAVSKGIWTTGAFVEGDAPYNFDGGATDFGVEFWHGQVVDVLGCMDETACNYNEEAATDDGSCVSATACDTCSGETDGSGVVIDNPEVGDSCDDGDEHTFDDAIVSCGLCSGQLCDVEVAILEATSTTVFCTDDEIDDTFTFNLIGGSGESSLLFATELDGTVLAALDVEPIDFNLSNDGEYLVYYMSYDGSPVLVDGDNIADFVGCFELSEPIVISVMSGDDCPFICEASAVISGEASLCEGELADITIVFEGTAPWVFNIAIDGFNLAETTTSENPTIFITNTAGSYTLTSMTDATGCLGTVSGKATITEFGGPNIVNVVETCSADLLTYVVTFEILGGDPGTYSIIGNPGTITGNTFTSDPIPSDNPYDFTVSDINNCTDNANGIFGCTCPATANISGDISVCSGETGCLQLVFTGIGPWAFICAIDGVDQPPITTIDNPYCLSTSVVGTYTLTSVSDANCVGTVLGAATVTESDGPIISNVVETCAIELLTYTVTFDITGGDPASYDVTGDSGSITGSTFTSDPIVDGDSYSFTVSDNSNCGSDNVSGVLNCTCPASAVISGDIAICSGECGDLVISFVGAAPWTFELYIDGISQLPPITTSDNPIFLCASVVGVYNLTSMADGTGCFGSFSGIATVTEFGSPVISNVVETISPDLMSYTVTFDVTGGDIASYVNIGTSPGSFVGNTFTSDLMLCGVPYVYAISDINDCNPASVTGFVDCSEIVDCPELGLNIGDECDDGNDDLIPGIVNENCECVSVEVDCPELGLNIEDACDDNNPNTIEDVVNDDCICEGEELVLGCMDTAACNFDADANMDDGSCINIGDACDDNDPETEGDMVNDDCVCEGTVGIVDLSDFDSELIIYPNPAQNELFLNFQLKEAGQLTFEIFDVLGNQVKSTVKKLNSGEVTHSLNTESFAAGMYFLRISNSEYAAAQKFLIVR